VRACEREKRVREFIPVLDLLLGVLVIRFWMREMTFAFFWCGESASLDERV
jgi:hypothetical protein